MLIKDTILHDKNKEISYASNSFRSKFKFNFEKHLNLQNNVKLLSENYYKISYNFSSEAQKNPMKNEQKVIKLKFYWRNCFKYRLKFIYRYICVILVVLMINFLILRIPINIGISNILFIHEFTISRTKCNSNKLKNIYMFNFS